MAALFHLSLPCSSIKATKEFYVNLLGASMGRHAQNWVDINLFGNQITFTKAGKFDFIYPSYTFEGTILPAFHFGVIMEKETWQTVLDRLKSKQASLLAESVFLKEKTGEHHSFFIKDPNGYTVEFKCFAKTDSIFST